MTSFFSRDTFSRESVDKIYEFTKRCAYNEGFVDGYKQCKQDILKHMKKFHIEEIDEWFM